MKKTLLAFATLVICTVAHAQNNPEGTVQSGTVYYKELKKIEPKFDQQSAQVAAMLPKERYSDQVLYFNKEATFYQKNHNTEHNGALKKDMGGGAMIIVHTYASRADNKVFTNLKNKKQVEQREFMTRLFLIEQEMDATKWKITGRQKTILDYPCQEAVLEEDEKKITAWFTPKIAIPAGPEKFYGLPGIILAIESSDGKYSITATSIDLDTPVDKTLFTKPAKGKKLTQKQFDKIVEEKKEEMKYGEAIESVTVVGGRGATIIKD